MTSEQSQMIRKLPKYEPAKIVGLIADTHIPARAKCLPEQVFKIFENADYIVHAGDLVDLSVIDELDQIAPVLAVHGNMDPTKIKERLPKFDSFKFLNWKIGVTHDPGTLFGSRKMQKIAQRNSLQVLVYGHTHSAHAKWEGNILLVNPGSPTNPIPPFLVKPSVALLKITEKNIVPEIIQI